MSRRSRNPVTTRRKAARAAGRAGEAADAYAALLAIQPDLPDTWFNLALMQRGGRSVDRPRLWRPMQQALRSTRIRGPEEVHLNRAVILFGRPGSERTRHRASWKACAGPDRPELPVRPCLNLGNLHEDKGERDAARAAYWPRAEAVSLSA